jgi:hypothetical protein
VQARTALAALAAVLLMAAVVPQTAAPEHGPVAADGEAGGAGPTVAVDREGPRSEEQARPDAPVAIPGTVPPAAEYEGRPDDADDDEDADSPDDTVDREDDHVATQGEPQVVYRYDVETRGEVTADTDDFAATTERILADARGWTLGGSVGFEHVQGDRDFTVVLASPEEVAAAHEECGPDYSCRVEDEIFINDRNWREATPAWHEAAGDLVTYRRYLVNHEVGHFLGFGHADCGGASQPAPVMQQQSVSTQDCEANAWPLQWEREQLAERLQVSVRDVTVE